MAVDISDYLATQRGAVGMVEKNATSDALLSGQSNLNTSYQTFLTLLTTQLKNQDPTAPLDPNTFTQQIVQMTGVQQQLLSNQLLRQLVIQGENGDVRGAIGLIGKTVTATGSEAVLKDGEARWAYELPKAAAAATLTVTDETGKVMWTGSAPNLAKGEHAFAWDGKGLHEGAEGKAYKLTVAATDANGAAIAAQIFVQGLVGSIRQGPEGAMVNVGGSEVHITAVKAVKG